MKLRSQYIASIVILFIFLVVITASVFLTNQQIAFINNQEQIATNINTGASKLSYISNDYLLYQQNIQLDLWQSQFSTISNNVFKLKASGLEQQIKINNVNNDLQNLGAVFNNSVSFLESAPRNESVTVLPAFQTNWDRLAVQNQALAFDASVLSKSFGDQGDQLKQIGNILILELIITFGVYFVSVYFFVYRRTFRSIAKLQEGTKIIGSGNLDYSIANKSDDEIGELSRAFNQMTTDLKTVTASKTDLEREIAERKKAEEALRASEQKANDLIKFAPSGIYELDYRIPPKFRSVNDAMCQILGYTREELLATSPFALLDDESKMRFQERIKKMIAGEKVDETVEFKVTRKDGREIFAVMNVQFTYKDGKPDGALVIAHDITERKKAEIALVEWAENLETIVKERTKELELASSYTRSLIEASLDPLVTISSEGKITDVNRATENVTGCTRDELIGSDFLDYFTEPEQARAGYLRVFTEGLVKDYPLAIKHKNGRITEVLYNAAVYRNPDGKIQGVFAAARDVTDLNKAELEARESAKKLKDSERLAAIGATAGMVGHDIRNPLQAITSDVYLAKSELASVPDSEEKKNALESLEEIEKNTDYINKIVQDLQDYARPLSPQGEETDLQLIIEKLLAKNSLPANIKVSVKVENEARKITTDSYYINRVMHNLVTNSVQAMPNGGKLTIAAYKQANALFITIKDTGVGIPKNIQSKMFTPMFTTKAKGQGFGLPVVKRMTEALGGKVTFESEVGKGTKFTIELPI